MAGETLWCAVWMCLADYKNDKPKPKLIQVSHAILNTLSLRTAEETMYEG